MIINPFYTIESIYNIKIEESSAVKVGEKSEDNHVQVVGKAIGTVSADEIPDAEDSAILKEIKAGELYEFEREDGIPL